MPRRLAGQQAEMQNDDAWCYIDYQNVERRRSIVYGTVWIKLKDNCCLIQPFKGGLYLANTASVSDSDTNSYF